MVAWICTDDNAVVVKMLGRHDIENRFYQNERSEWNLLRYHTASLTHSENEISGSEI